MMKFFIMLASLLILAGCEEQQKKEIKPLPKVHIATPFVELPPYYIYTKDSGIEQDILEDAFQLAGYQPVFSRIRKREKVVSNPDYHYNCASTVNEKEKSLKGVAGFFSDEIISYQDAVITLKTRTDEVTKQDNTVHINELTDLEGKTIEAFKSAKKVLGLEDILKGNHLYHEHSGKASQIVLLYRGRIDALIMDERIFKHFRKKVKNLVDINQAVRITYLFDMVPYHLFCTEKKYVNAFNQGLEKLRNSGRYRKIFEKYLD